MRISGWRFDGGDPTYISAIDSWTDRRTPTWRCGVRGTQAEVEEVRAWLSEQCGDQCDHTYRFNSGDPYVEINIRDETNAIAFKMRFG
jgi:hypothetical protein